MKDKIHPKYYTDAEVICSCGNTFTTGSTKKTLKVELCSNCHPFFTGQQKFIDTEGRIDKFEKKRKLAEKAKKVAVEKKKEKAAKKAGAKAKSDTGPSLKELLKQVREAEKNKK